MLVDRERMHRKIRESALVSKRSDKRRDLPVFAVDAMEHRNHEVKIRMRFAVLLHACSRRCLRHPCRTVALEESSQIRTKIKNLVRVSRARNPICEIVGASQCDFALCRCTSGNDGDVHGGREFLPSLWKKQEKTRGGVFEKRFFVCRKI